jgi:hypothetical protein
MVNKLLKEIYMQTKRIETYSLFEFCQVVEQSVIEGWRFDFESNELFPTAFGSMLVTGMVKAEYGEDTQEQLQREPELEPVVCEINTESNTQVKRGRKPKDVAI